jgi:hypothetical protein
MARVAGVQIETNAKGALTYARFDLKKHGEKITPILQELGVIEDEFDKKIKNGISGDELVADVKKYIRTLPWKK